ncbi:MAG: glycosyltransferase family 9 protein [Verrucomicrobiota bacterium]
MNNPPLVIYHKQLGDVLMFEPALAKLAALTGGSVRFSTRASFAPMISLMENVEPAGYDPLRYASAVYSFSERFHAAFKALITLSPEKRFIAIVQAHIRPWHHLVYRAGCSVAKRVAPYQAEHFFDNIPCPATMPFRPPRLLAPPSEWLPEGLPDEYVLLHATSAWKRKSWPSERWAAVLNDLHDAGLGPFVLTGGAADWEREFVAAIQRGTRARVLDLSGKTNLESYLAIVSKARMVLCIDGSATHLAAAFRRPVLTLFGPTPAARWHYASETSAMVDAKDFTPEAKPAVSYIPEEVVTQAALSLWGRCVVQS